MRVIAGVVYSLVYILVTNSIGITQAVSWEKDLLLTLKEKQTLDKFRKQVTPLLKNAFMRTDIYLIRWLRARDFNIRNAEEMLKENLRWREVNKMDTIRQENFDDMWEEFPATVGAVDKENRPVGTIDIYAWDIREAAVTGKGQRLLRYLDMLLENVTMAVYESQRQGLNVTQWTVLANTEGFNMINHGCPLCIPLWIRFTNSIETHYPGWVNEFVIVDAPSAVHTVFDIVKPFLNRQTRDAIKILGQNRAQWMSYLDARMLREERTAMYGGSRVFKLKNN